MKKIIQNGLHTIGEAKVSYRTTGIPYAKVRSSRDVYRFLSRVWDTDTIECREAFCVICLNRAKQVVAYQFIATGGVSEVQADPKVIFQVGLLTNASALIVAHNHPSGNLVASHADMRLTRKLLNAGDFLEMPVLDHLIVSKDGFLSLYDAGKL